MAQTKKKRRKKHRGTQGGRIDTSKRRAKPRSRAEAKAQARSRRSGGPKADAPPTWRSSALRGVAAAVIFAALLMPIFKRPVGAALGPRRLHARLLHPRRLLHRHDDVEETGAGADPFPRGRMSLDVEMLTVGPVAENCFLLRREGSDRVLIVDPGEEAERILAALEATGAKAEAILLTHCHFDHIGAVAPVAAATGAPVYCPEIETPILADIMAFVPWEGFGPFENYEADETVAGGETLELAGPRARRHLHPRPQPRPRHLLGARRGLDLLRRRPLPGLGRPGRPARRRRADADGVDPHPARLPPRTRRRSIPATWGRPRWAPSAPPTRSSPSWPG